MCPAIERHTKQSTALPSSPARTQGTLMIPSRGHILQSRSPGLSTNPKSFRGPEVSASETKTLHEDYRFYTSYSLVARSPRFKDSIMQPDHPHVQTLQCPYINASCNELWQISLHDHPNNQAARSGLLRGNHNVPIMHLQKSKIPECASTA